MGRLGYDPGNIDDSKGGGKPAAPGRYPFVVVQVEEKQFTNYKGLRVVMEVMTKDRDIKVYENLMYAKQSQWRLKQFLESTGFDYEEIPDIEDLYEAQGVADFKLGKKQDDGRQFLDVDHFLEQGTKATGPSGKSSSGAGSQPPLPSRRRNQERSQGGGGQRGGGQSRGRSRGRRRQRDDEQPPGDGGKRGTMLGGGRQEEPDDRQARENDEDGLADEGDLSF